MTEPIAETTETTPALRQRVERLRFESGREPAEPYMMMSSDPTVGVELRAAEFELARREREPAPPSLADLCRAAILLLDRYEAARTMALRCASAGAGTLEASDRASALAGDVAAALSEVANVAQSGVWYWRAVLAHDTGIIDAEAWPVELAALAAASEARATEAGAA